MAFDAKDRFSRTVTSDREKVVRNSLDLTAFFVYWTMICRAIGWLMLPEVAVTVAV